MSFFTHTPEEPPTPEPMPPQPEWLGPPNGQLPTPLLSRVKLFGNDRAVLTLDHLNVYKTGIEFSLNVWARSPGEIHDIPWEAHDRRGTIRPDFMRLGFEFANGARWTNLPNNHNHFENEPDGPVLIGQGGGGGPHFWSMKQWLWPLPPPDETHVHVAWPQYGIDETSVTIDTSGFASAAASAEELWPK